MTDQQARTTLNVMPLVGVLAWAGLGMAVLGVVLDVIIGLGNTLWPIIVLIRDLIYPNAEANVFAWFSAVLLAMIAIGFLVLTLAEWGKGRFPWALATVAAIAGLLSIDEGAQLHERFAIVTRHLGVSWSWTYVWLIIGIPLAIAAGALLLWLSRRLERILRRRLIIAGVIFLAGALGMEALGGFLTKASLGVSDATFLLVHGAAVLVEEGLEVTGAIVALWALLSYVRVERGPGFLTVTPRQLA